MSNQSKYKPEYCDELKAGMSKGLLDVEIYSNWDISRQTFLNWRNDYEDFAEAYSTGWAKCEAWWISYMRVQFLANNDKGFKYCNFIMNNKFGWGREESRGSTTNNIQIGNMNMLNSKNPDELLEILKTKLSNMKLLGNLEEVPIEVLTSELKGAIND